MGRRTEGGERANMTSRSRRREGEQRGDPRVGLQPLRPLQSERLESNSTEEGVWEPLSAWAAELRADLMFPYTLCDFQGILRSSSRMSTVANFCNHKHTSHMMQLTPRRYLEKGRCRMERQKWGGGGGGWRKRKVYKGQGCVREKMYKYRFNLAKCLWQDAAAPSLQHCSLSDRESN